MINFSSSTLAPSLNTSSSISLFNGCVSASKEKDLDVCLETIRGFLESAKSVSAGEI